MTEAVQTLLQTRTPKDFAKQFKTLEKEWGDQRAFVQQAAEFLSPRLYERFYDNDVPHAYFGLAAADYCSAGFPEDRSWWPFVQQAWHVTHQRLRKPVEIDSFGTTTEGSPQERAQSLLQAIAQQQFSEAFSLARGLLKDDPALLREVSMEAAHRDASLGGFKFLYLALSWHLVERLPQASPDQLLFPALHLLANQPPDRTLEQSSRESSLGTGSAALSTDSYEALEQAILFGRSADEALTAAAGLNLSSEALLEGLLLAGSTAVVNSRAGHWLEPIRAFLYTFLTWKLAKEGDQRRQASARCAALLQRAASRSRSADQNRELDAVARRLCPTDTFNTLRSVASHSDPYATATAVYAILGMDDSKKDELFHSLATLAAKNDGQMGQGYDLMMAHASAECYRQIELPQRDRFPVNCGFFLGRIQKSYELFGGYGV